MNRKVLILSVVFTTLIITSCIKDLDVKPIDPNVILSSNLLDRPGAMKQTLAKLYAGFITRGQNGDDNDINTSDANFTCFIRAWWNVQELTTDEVICAWGDPGIADLNTQTWTPNNPFLTGVYSRIIWLATLCNDYIRLTAGNDDPEIAKYNAEARFLRALAYYYAIDLFANPAFTTEDDQVGSFFPKQTTRADLFSYIESELLDIKDKLGEPKFELYRADKAAAWMLLAKLYLNAQIYTGTARWADCKTYCDLVINSNYSLADDYRQNFSSDNDESPEMIFAFAQDGINIQGATGTSFIMHSSSNGDHIDITTLGLTSNWGGNRTRKEFVNVLVDTIATYGNVSVSTQNDVFFDQSEDQRLYIRTLSQWDIAKPSVFGQGIGVYKFTNMRSTGGGIAAIVDYNSDFASTDFPIFRLSEAYLMRAEALLRSGNAAAAVNDVNFVRERAFAGTTHNITAGELTEQYMLDELGREFYYEGHRRTDLIRFGKFTGGDYLWSWKGNAATGTSTSAHLNIFPIPGDEVSANPNIRQNLGY
jgi:starch-binding outer membrane protein, SusD/RagB family